MNQADKQYLALCKRILRQGKWEDGNRTGEPTRKLFGQEFRFDLSKEFPILTTKEVNFEALKKEMFWIYVMQSNDVNVLAKQLGVKIWNSWRKPDGTIGPAYGWQVKHYNQIDRLIDGLKNNPFDRGHIINLWNFEHLADMSIRPCAFLTMWDVSPDGKLNCTLVQRSADVPVGVPFNFTQYALLVHMVAQVVGLQPGEFVHYMNNAHIYQNQLEGMKVQVEREPYKAPKLWINKSVTNFYDFKLDDLKLVGYQHHEKIKFEVSV